MPGLFDKISKAAQHTAAEGKTRLEIRTLSSRLDEKAQELGHLMFRQHRGETITNGEYVRLLDEMTRLEAERQAKELELDDLRRPDAESPAASTRRGETEENAPACSCGAEILPGARFCPSCGKSLIPASP